MEITTVHQSMLYLAINLGYAVAALFVGVIAILLIDKYIFTNIDFIEEIKKGNVAAALFFSSLLLFVGLVIGIVMS